jgi:uncharacterized protein (DUF1330 family)
MSTYMIVTIKTVKDRPSMDQYWAKVVATFADTGVKPLSVYTPLKIVEGEGPIDGMVLVEFPDMETANRWYESPAYQEIKHFRWEGADSGIVFLDSGGSESPDDWMPHTKDHVRGS